eukprot:TRINITY_DN829_c0_g1_i1.p1 TRINITY_DN829_c0_g1~~TRINITY_DN829_c0_g1_i1.p1  ORF type:complete len:997 (-),score=205.43 TRINITY_DN829_c0_g1_i1:717-3707(-)
MDLNHPPMVEDTFADLGAPGLVELNQPPTLEENSVPVDTSADLGAPGLVELNQPPTLEENSVPVDTSADLGAPGLLEQLTASEGSAAVTVNMAQASLAVEDGTGEASLTIQQTTVEETGTPAADGEVCDMDGMFNIAEKPDAVSAPHAADGGVCDMDGMFNIAEKSAAVDEGTGVGVTAQEVQNVINTVIEDLNIGTRAGEGAFPAVSDVGDTSMPADALATTVDQTAAKVLDLEDAIGALLSGGIPEGAPLADAAPVPDTAPSSTELQAENASLADAGLVRTPAPAINEGGTEPELATVTIREKATQVAETTVEAPVPGEPSSLPAGDSASAEATNLEASGAPPFSLEHKIVLGSAVEGSTDESGLRGAWYSGIIDSIDGKYALVEFDELLADDETTKLKEWYPIAPPWVIRLKDGSPLDDSRIAADTYKRRLRPVSTVQSFNEKTSSPEGTAAVLSAGDAVEVQQDDGWWEAVVVSTKDREVTVFYPGESVDGTADIAQVRPALTLKDGAWVVDTEKKPFTSLEPVAAEKGKKAGIKNKVSQKATKDKKSSLKKNPVPMKKAGSKTPAKSPKSSALKAKKSPAAKSTSNKTVKSPTSKAGTSGRPSKTATPKPASAKKAAKVPAASPKPAAKSPAKSSAVAMKSPGKSPGLKSPARSSSRKTVPTSKVVEKAAEVKSPKKASAKKSGAESPSAKSPAPARNVGQPSSENVKATLANGSPAAKSSGKASKGGRPKGSTNKKSKDGAAEKPATAHVATVLLPSGSSLPTGPVEISKLKNEGAKGKGRGAKGAVPAVVVEAEVVETDVVLTSGGSTRSTRSRGPALEGHAAVLQAQVESKLAAASFTKEVVSKSPALDGKSPLGKRGREEGATEGGAPAKADGVASPRTAAGKEGKAGAGKAVGQGKKAIEAGTTKEEEAAEETGKKTKGGVAGKRKAAESKTLGEANGGSTKRGKRAAAGLSEEAILPARASRKTTSVAPAPTAAAKSRAAKRGAK